MGAKNDINDRIEEQRAQARAWLKKEEEKAEKQRKEEERSARKRTKPKREPMKISLMKKMMLFSLGPLLVMGIVITVYTIFTLSTTLKKMEQSSLSNFAISVRGSLENVAEGSLNVKDGVLYIGDNPIGNDVDYLDSFTSAGEIELSLYYDNKVYLSTIADGSGNRLVGGTLPDEVKSTVVGDSKLYSTDNDVINGEKYYSVYLPIRDSSKKTVGVLLACQKSSNVANVVNKQIFSLAGIASAILIVSAFIVGYSSFSIASSIKKMEESLTALADGYLSITVNLSALSRNDEIGTMARALQNTAKRMTGVVHEINSIIRRLVKAGDSLEESSEQSSVTAGGISSAVSEISKGAATQAEDVEKANLSVTEMGDGISSIVNSLSSLKESTEIMLDADKHSEDIIAELFESGKGTAVALEEVVKRVTETDKSVAKIEQAVSLITNIAEETSLLSLNASIEAARAGEAGRGFSVVAIQIQKLAEESSKSADRIRETIEELSKDSHSAVSVMAEMSDAIYEQQKKLELTKNQFEKVSKGIGTTITETKNIYGLSQNCAKERENVYGIIQSLSKVSESNADSSESTTEAMINLNDSIDLVADSAKNLQRIALELEDNVKFFKL